MDGLIEVMSHAEIKDMASENDSVSVRDHNFWRQPRDPI